MTVVYQITNNINQNGWEITFDDKPAEAVRTALKSLGMRWHSGKQCWYISKAKATECQLVDAILQASDPDTDPATVVTDGYLGGGAVYGSKSHLGLYGADLTAAIRADLKAAGLKGVTVRKCSGDGITITVSISPSDLLTVEEYAETWKPAGYWIDTPNGSIHRDTYYYSMAAAEQQEIRRQAAQAEITRYRTEEQEINHYHVDDYTHLTPDYRAKLHKILDIVGQYHYDSSNSMVDYFDTNFYLSLYTKPDKTH